MVYLDCFEDVKKKLIYNSLFYDSRLPFSKKEKKLLEFVNKESKHLIEANLFEYSCGKVNIISD